ncbi:MAG: endolytic transglycosylase MltG [Balneolaceae bacterium]
MIKRFIFISTKELVVGIAIFLVAFLSVFTSRYSRLESSSAILFNEGTHVYLGDNTNLEGLVSCFKKQGLDFNEGNFRWASKLLGWRTFKKGHYFLEDGYSYQEIFSKFALGIQDPVDVVILPGITVDRFANSMASQLSIDSLAIIEQLSDSVFLSELKLSREQLFGRMLPETYSMYWTTNPKAAIERILTHFNTSVIKPYNDRAEELGYSIDDIVTMASIVEWEATLSDEKPIISGLYWNRLKRRMHLQADPTVNYALGERRRLLFKDYTFNHPFNTYVNYGLPPGAITNPSLSTIQATLYPEQHNYLYMVANPEGGHVFTRTFKEHQVESEKWRIWLQRQYRIKRQREAAESANI